MCLFLISHLMHHQHKGATPQNGQPSQSASKRSHDESKGTANEIKGTAWNCGSSLSLSLEVLLETGGIRPFREFGVLSLSLANTDNTDRWLD